MPWPGGSDGRASEVRLTISWLGPCRSARRWLSPGEPRLWTPAPMTASPPCNPSSGNGPPSMVINQLSVYLTTYVIDRYMLCNINTIPYLCAVQLIRKNIPVLVGADTSPVLYWHGACEANVQRQDRRVSKRILESEPGLNSRERGHICKRRRLEATPQIRPPDFQPGDDQGYYLLNFLYQFFSGSEENITCVWMFAGYWGPLLS